MIKRKKKAKPATESQEKARERNWNKGQMKCMIAIANKIYNSKTTPNKEKMNLEIIMAKSKAILQNWTK